MKQVSDYEYEELIKKAKKWDDYDREEKSNQRLMYGLCIIGVFVVALVIGFFMWVIPNYSVWHAEMKGKAQLSEAEYSKQVQIQEAQSNLEAEKLNAEAEVERAKGAAEARRTEGLGMSPEQYVQYLWVKKLSLADSKIIYLPTENGMPVLTQEAEK